MAYLDWITIKGFKSIRSTEQLELGPINVLIGENGVGKSNFLGAFRFLNAIGAGELQNYVARAGGADNVFHFGSRETQRLTLHISFGGGVNQYRLELSPSDYDSMYPARETVFFGDKDQYDEPYDRRMPHRGAEAGISDPDLRDGIGHHVRKHLQSWKVFQFHDTSATSALKKTANVNDNRRLRADGSNLPAFLYFLREKSRDSYNLIQGAVRLVAPFFDHFSLEPLYLNPEKILLEWKHQGTDAYFSASALSDGSLRFMALATLLLQPSDFRPSTILLDEPELGLHPYAIAILSSLIKRASMDTQILMATQSSLLLDHFEPEDILVAERRNGGTEFARLASSDLDAWLEDYSLGQLWEKNYLGGRPHREEAYTLP